MNKIKRIISIFVLVAILLLTTGCSQKISDGEVYQKEYREAHTEVRMIPVTMYNGKTSTVMIVPYTYYYPDRYIVYIKKFEDNEWKTANYYVTKDIYDNIEIGNQFEYVKGRDLTEEPYTREKK